MNTTLYRSLALLTSILALTSFSSSSFSSSSVPSDVIIGYFEHIIKRTKTNKKDNNSQGPIIDDVTEYDNSSILECASSSSVPSDVIIDDVEDTIKCIKINEKDNNLQGPTIEDVTECDNPWMFAYTQKGLGEPGLLKDSDYALPKDYDFRSFKQMVRSYLANHLEEGELHSTFSICKKRENKQIVGLFFKKGENRAKLMLYEIKEDRLKPLDTQCAEKIKNREVDLTKFLLSASFRGDDGIYYLMINWRGDKAPNYIEFSCNGDAIEVADYREPHFSTENSQAKTGTSFPWKAFGGLVVVGIIVICTIFMFPKNSKMASLVRNTRAKQIT